MPNVISGTTQLSGSPTRARVSLLDSATGAVVMSQLSDMTTGKFAFQNIPAGLYETMIVRPGYMAQLNGPWSLDGADTQWANVVSLLHFNGTDASTTFTDQTGKTWTAAGNAQIDTAQSQFGGASGLFDGAGDYISTPNHADWDFGSGDFTIECFVRRNSAALGHVVGKWSTSNRGWVIFIKADGNAQFSYSTTGSNFIDAVGTIPIPLSTWVHVAAVRSGATVTVYVGGVQAVVHNIGASTIFNSTRVLEVGLENSIGYAPFDGWLDELRITKGVARYVTDFTPPVAAFPNS